MEQYLLSARNSLLTQEGKLTIWSAYAGRYADGPNGLHRILRVSRGREKQMRTYTIKTYAGIYGITCANGLLINTEKGYIPIDKLKAGDVLVVKGEFVHKKLTLIKEITASRYSDEGTTHLWLKDGESEIFINKIACKI